MWGKPEENTWGASAPTESSWETSAPAVPQDSFLLPNPEANPSETKPALPPLNYESLGSNLKEIEWSSLSLTPVIPSYAESSQTSQRSTEEIQEFLSSSKTLVKGEDQLKPILTFQEADLPSSLLSTLESCKFEKPTIIQSLAWPIALSGKDVVAVACTGSGKTLSYLIPMLVHISKQPAPTEVQGPIGLVVVPTRELAKQIIFECNRFGKCFEIRSVCIYGGNGRQFQMKDLEAAPQLVVATPGRLLDFLESGTISLKNTSFLVVDEGDRMIDMGFCPQLKKVLTQIRPDRQIFMCTATWPSSLDELSQEFLKNPVALSVGGVEFPLNPNIKQEIKIIETEDKLETLAEILEPLKEKRVLVFVDTKTSCEQVAEELKAKEIPAVALHGDKSTKDRMGALIDFRAGRKLVVVATDVASRGLDIRDLEFVVLYDFPRRIEDYVHRIGRTARGSSKGTAISLFTKDNSKSASALIKVLEESGQNIPRDLRRMVRKPKAENGETENQPRRRRSRSLHGDN